MSDICSIWHWGHCRDSKNTIKLETEITKSHRNKPVGSIWLTPQSPALHASYFSSHKDLSDTGWYEHLWERLQPDSKALQPADRLIEDELKREKVTPLSSYFRDRVTWRVFYSFTQKSVADSVRIPPVWLLYSAHVLKIIVSLLRVIFTRHSLILYKISAQWKWFTILYMTASSRD